VDLAVGQGEEASPLTVALDQERTELLDLEHPERLGDPELEPVHVEDTLDAAPVRGAETVADGGEIDGAVGHEPLAVGELRETGLADDHLGARALEPAAHRLAEAEARCRGDRLDRVRPVRPYRRRGRDRKSTRLNSSHLVISYAVFCLKKKNKRRRSGLSLPDDARELKPRLKEVFQSALHVCRPHILLYSAIGHS